MTQPTDPVDPTVRRVRIERRGGLAGLAVSATHDYAALSEAQQQALGQVIKAASAARGQSEDRGAPGADRFSYRTILFRSIRTRNRLTVRFFGSAVLRFLVLALRFAGSWFLVL